MIRGLVCDDHFTVRQGIKQLLADADDIVLAAEAENGPEAIRRVREAAGNESIHVVLMDIAMPHRDGLDVLRQLRGEFPRLPVPMLSTYPDEQYAVRSPKLGAAGYLNKSADSEQMTGAIRKVVAGRAVHHAVGGRAACRGDWHRSAEGTESQRRPRNFFLRASSAFWAQANSVFHDHRALSSFRRTNAPIAPPEPP